MTQPDPTPPKVPEYDLDFDETQADRTRRDVVAKVLEWFDAMVAAEPKLDNGDCHTLELVGGLCAYSDKGEPLFEVRAKASIEGSI